MSNKNPGKRFQDDFQSSAKKVGIYCERLKDNPMWGDKGVRVRQSKNPYDFYMFDYPYFFALELKSTKGTSFSFNEKIIKQNQIDKLVEVSGHPGTVAGFIFNFRPTDRRPDNHCYFVSIQAFQKFKETTTKKSINLKDCETIGIKIQNNKKITRYFYDLSLFTSLFKKGAVNIESLHRGPAQL